MLWLSLLIILHSSTSSSAIKLFYVCLLQPESEVSTTAEDYSSEVSSSFWTYKPLCALGDLDHTCGFLPVLEKE